MIPRHVAIIPDGNRRWARNHGLPPQAGHARGLEALEQVIPALLDGGVKEISVWGSSLNNLQKRADSEVNALYQLFELWAVRMLKRFVTEVGRRSRVRISGRWEERLPPATVKSLRELVEGTQRGQDGEINLMLAYDGRDEMLRAINALCLSVGGPVSATDLEAQFWTAGMGSVDLLIRTGATGDPHLSDGFMMWLAGDAQLVFSELLWPDFGPDGARAALAEYARRERRFGA